MSFPCFVTGVFRTNRIVRFSSVRTEGGSEPPIESIPPGDRPFLIVMKKRDAKQPFFITWVDNAELLCKK